MRTGNELQFLEVLTSTPGINTTLINRVSIAPCDVVDNDGNTLLHTACAKGNTDLVKVLVENGADVLKPDIHGDAPIHKACTSGRLDILKVLLGCTKCDRNQQNAVGDTALHIVCRMRTGNELQFLEVLTSTPGINTTKVNHEGIVPFDIVDSDGNTLLHNACTKGNSKIVRLLFKNGADVLKPDRHGNAPIHISCKHSGLDTLKEIVALSNCSPNQQNEEGDTALHIVCRMTTGNELQFLEVLTSTPGINLTLINNEGFAPFEVVEKDGNTLFHAACAEGNAALVEFLIKKGVNILKSNRDGDAPIHTACKHARLDVLKLILNHKNCDPNQQNARGDTALHIVCRKNKKQFLNILISTVGIDPETVNHNGHTPTEVVGISYSAIETIGKFLEYKRSSIQAYLKIFVVGNSGTGKSTLIKAVTTEASQLRKYAPLSRMRYVNPSDVPPHTAGIVPIRFSSKHFGNAVLYDFAGQHVYYSSHAAVMENLILPSPPLFLLLIDISKSKEMISKELFYWWHFINNQSQKAAAPPHVILAGSHKDMVKTEDREELEVMIRNLIREIPVSFEYVGYFPLDCRRLVSQELSVLLNELNTTSQVLRQTVDVNLHCHILNALLRAPEFQDLVYCKVVDIMNKIESDDALLPKTFSQLIPLLEGLNDQGYILLLQNHTNESKSWVILKPDVLLTEVNGSVFAPKYFKEHCEFAMNTGVVTLSKLKEKFAKYNHEVIVDYMTHLEFCFRIDDQHTLDMITNNEVSKTAANEKYYFFPALVRVENLTNVYQPHQSIDYECGWLYKCSKEREQLTTRFLHVLILRLAFACEPPDVPTETESVVLLRSCSVWKHGIAWWTNDGIEVIVEVGLQCHWVAVLLRCPDAKKIECAELRSKVIHTVLKAKTDFCPAITMKKYLIAPSSLKYPFEERELTLYSMREVTAAAIEGKDYARDKEGKNLITIPQLLPFEPYYNMGDLVPKFFCGDTSIAVTSEELTQIAVKCHKKLAELNTAFKPDVVSFQRECEKADCTEVERCVALFHILQRRGCFKTWRDFQQKFSRFSIFCKQSLLEHIQKDKDRPLGDGIESRMASDSVRASEDVPQSLLSPVPNSPIRLPSQHIPHTSIDIDSTEGAAKEMVAESGYAHSTPVDTTRTTHISEDNLAGLTPTMIDLENKVIPTVCPMWREMGRQLHLKTYILDEIDADCRVHGVRRCCTRMFEEWLKQDTEASWYAVLSACKKVKENLASGPNKPCTKESIESLKQLISTLLDFLATLCVEDVPQSLPSPVPKSPSQLVPHLHFSTSSTSPMSRCALAEKIVQVTNKEEHIIWEEYGLRLHIPQSALPEDLHHWQLKIAVFLSGQFELPQDGVLVSAIYSFSHNLGDRKLRNPVTLEIQHCASNKTLNDLYIVRANSRAKDPLKFEIIHSGIFKANTGYGVIELDQFCSISCWLWRRVRSMFFELEYCARLYYTDIRYQSFYSDLYILPNLNPYFQAIEKRLKKPYEEGASSKIMFEDEEISIDITERCHGWQLIPINALVIRQRDAENFSSNQCVHSCKVHISWRESSEVQPFQYRMILKGAKGDYNFLTIISPPDCLVVTSPNDLLHTQITDQDIATIARDYLVRWEELAPPLELTEPQKYSIQETFSRYEDQKHEALHMWKRNKGSRATYSAFIAAAEELANIRLADNVRTMLRRRL